MLDTSGSSQGRFEPSIRLVTNTATGERWPVSAAAPLRPAADAVTVDTTGFTFDDAFALLLSTIRARLGQEG